MQTAVGKIHFVGDHFVPDIAIPHQLVIDASSGEEPLLGLFDPQMSLKYLGSLDSWNSTFPAHPLASLNLHGIRSVVSTIDLLFFPNEVYDVARQDLYGSYLLDDGVTSVRAREFPALDVHALYRERLDGMTELWQHFPAMETVPLSALLPDRLVGVLNSPTLGIHLTEREVVFYLFDQGGRLLYHNTFHYDNEDGFNHRLIQVLELLGDRRDAFEALLSGNVAPGDSYYQRVEKYLRVVRMADPATLTGLTIHGVSDLSDDIRHRMLPLYLLCAL